VEARRNGRRNIAAKAQDYIQAGNFPKARVALRNVLKIDPKDADAYFLVAQVEEKEKNWRNAVANYQQVVEIVPDHKEALIVLAKYYLEAKLADEVGRAADKVLAKHPQDPQAQALKIALLAQQGQVNQAMVRAEELSKQHTRPSRMSRFSWPRCMARCIAVKKPERRCNVRFRHIRITWISCTI
jgi:tetratricopeptide (TPR) repeat protein